MGRWAVNFPKAALPAADLANIRKLAAVQELGTEYNMLILNPQEQANLSIIYGDAATWLSSQGFSLAVSNQVTAGTAYAVTEGMVGQVRYEQPLNTVSYRDDKTESTWVQASIRAVFATTMPAASMLPMLSLFTSSVAKAPTSKL